MIKMFESFRSMIGGVIGRGGVTNEEKKTVAPRHFDLPVKNVDELFPGIDKVVAEISAFCPHQEEIQCLPVKEVVTVASIVKYLKPERIFEFGTYKGFSTMMLALNSPDSAEIITLDIDPAKRETHQHGTGVGGFSSFTVGEFFLGRPSGSKIRQLFVDSAGFNFAPFKGREDFIFIDADHSYEFVRKDTENAFAMLRPGGTILWDDYVWDIRFTECEGVSRVLHEMMNSRIIYQIAGTRLAVYVDQVGR